MEFSLNPDRERMNLTLVMGLLVNGRTVLDDFSWPNGAEKFAAALAEFGLTYELHGHQLVMGGCGFQYRFPSLLTIDFPEHESVLLWTLASKDSEQVYTFAAGDDEAAADAKFAAWKKEKENKFAAAQNKKAQDKKAQAAERLAAEKKINEEIAKKVAEKKAAEAAAKAEAEAAKAAEESAPVEETPAEA